MWQISVSWQSYTFLPMHQTDEIFVIWPNNGIKESLETRILNHNQTMLNIYYTRSSHFSTCVTCVTPQCLVFCFHKRQALLCLQRSFRVPNRRSPAMFRPPLAVSVTVALLTCASSAAQLVRAISTVIHVVTYQVGVYAELSVTPEVLACQFCKCKQWRGQSCFWTSETELVCFHKQIWTEYYSGMRCSVV